MEPPAAHGGGKLKTTSANNLSAPQVIEFLNSAGLFGSHGPVSYWKQRDRGTGRGVDR